MYSASRLSTKPDPSHHSPESFPEDLPDPPYPDLHPHPLIQYHSLLPPLTTSEAFSGLLLGPSLPLRQTTGSTHVTSNLSTQSDPSLHPFPGLVENVYPVH